MGRGNIRSVVPTLCYCLYGEYNHAVLNSVTIFKKFSKSFQTLLWAQNRPFLTIHISGGEAPKMFKFIAHNALFQSNMELKLQR
jgi:hypothetical protein